MDCNADKHSSIQMNLWSRVLKDNDPLHNRRRTQSQSDRAAMQQFVIELAPHLNVWLHQDVSDTADASSDTRIMNDAGVTANDGSDSQEETDSQRLLHQKYIDPNIFIRCLCVAVEVLLGDRKLQQFPKDVNNSSKNSSIAIFF